ncbi:DUF2746 domain-containing protein [Mycolicibacterium houstonense]|uniref:DUF2746 domain-containing protein n=1 Tax=Mycolicibacterium houstonense TaxID=146021 RepID=UPI00083669A0|nr:DUF2746 domain-containing protein [Mycolicibacterium houstonense]
MTPFNPDSWLDIVAYLIIIAGMIGVAVLPVWLQRRKVNDIHDQTVNSHKDKDNLRDQVDRLESTVDRLEGAIEGLTGVVSDGFRCVNRELGALQKGQELERLERIAGDQRGR